MDIEKNATAGACVAIARADRKKAIKETGMKCLFIIAATLFIIVVATDAPLTPDQCKRLARRAGLGLGRTGGLAFDGSGDIFIAFSTANRLGNNAGGGPREHTVRTLSHGCMDPLFRATVEATHEAIVNAMCAATDTDGILGRRMYALPLDEVRGIMRRYESL